MLGFGLGVAVSFVSSDPSILGVAAGVLVFRVEVDRMRVTALRIAERVEKASQPQTRNRKMLENPSLRPSHSVVCRKPQP